MQLTVYGTFTRFRSWNKVGHIYGSAAERSAALRETAEEECEDVPVAADDESLVSLLGEKEHEVHLFENEITV
jgi:hypothetical protein